MRCPDDPRLSAAASPSAVPKCRCRRAPAIPTRMCSVLRIAFPTRTIAATRRPMRRWKNISACSTRIGFARGVLVQGSAHGRDNSAMLDALRRQPERLRGVAVADAMFRPTTLRAWNAIRRPRLALQSFLPRRPVALSRRRAAERGREACACDGRARLASAALDRRQGFAGDDSAC
mgnify:CR=1 FL=1